uniref:SJCHGC04954 protein n=1 Tax=Schistosoma japonicum TaxID=6182 RepID=Q5D952_SCHJA|nr:SJCHGC04954 protein [Schistosoma japonicum]
MVTLMLADSLFAFQMFSNCRNAAFTLLIRIFVSVLDHPSSSITLPSYVKISTSSRVSPSSVIGLVLVVLYLRILLFHLCMLRPIIVCSGCCYTVHLHLHLLLFVE